MTSVVTAPREDSSRPSGETPHSRIVGNGAGRDFLPGLLAAGILVAVEFVAGGGNALGANTWIQVGLVVLAAATAIVAVLLGGTGPRFGAGAVAAFGALAALTYASIAWSVQPANSWLEANRTLSYLAAFATALLLARMAPGRWRAALGAIATAATVACAYSLLAKVFPGTLDPRDPFGRLRAPFDYWNAVGLMAAMGLPACLWAGSRRDGPPLLRALSAPAIAILISAVVLSLSRGSVLVAVIACAVWFAFAPVRLRSALMLGVGGAGGAAISAWGLAHNGISADNVSAASRVSAGHGFGVVLLVALVLSAAAGLLAMRALDGVPVSSAWRRRIGTALVILVALVPVGGLAAIARSHRGLGGEVSHLWHTLTSTSAAVSDHPGRLAQLSNSRPHYWSLAAKIGAHHPFAGVGALGFATAQEQYATGPAWKLQLDNVTHAHSYVMETFADLGAIGLAVSLVLLIAWALAAARTFASRREDREPAVTRPPPAGDLVLERTGLLALLAIVITFGVHSLIDWTWFIPGDAILGLACAGWLAGRGPLRSPIGLSARHRRVLRSPGAVLTAISVTLVTVVAMWFVVAPLRSSDAYSSALSAALRGDGGAALSDARAAATEDPASIDPLFLLSRLYSTLGQSGAARTELTDAVSRQPSNPRSWEQLGCYDLGRHSNEPAQYELHRALALEPAQTQILTDPTGFCASVAA